MNMITTALLAYSILENWWQFVHLWSAIQGNEVLFVIHCDETDVCFQSS